MLCIWVKLTHDISVLLLLPEPKETESICSMLLRRGVCCLTCMSVHKMKFLSFSSGTTNQSFVKFSTRIYMSILYCVMHFHIHCSSTPYSLNIWPGMKFCQFFCGKFRLHVTELHWIIVCCLHIYVFRSVSCWLLVWFVLLYIQKIFWYQFCFNCAERQRWKDIRMSIGQAADAYTISIN